MAKNKIIALVLALVMVVVVFAGCGNNSDVQNSDSNQQGIINGVADFGNNDEDAQTSEADDTTDDSTTESNISVDTSNKGYITSKEDFVNKISQFVDISLYDELTEDDSSSFSSYSYNIKYENKVDYNLDYKVTLGDGTEFTMPISFSDLEALGWELLGEATRENDIKPGFMSYGTIRNSEGKEIYVSAYNPSNSGETVKFKDCQVNSVELQQYSSFDSTKKIDEAIDFTVCDGITNTSTIGDVIFALGNPTMIYCAVFYDDDGNYENCEITIEYVQSSSAYNNIEFKFSGDGNYLLTFSYDVDPR